MMRYSRETLLSAIRAYSSQENKSVRKLALESGVSYSNLKDFLRGKAMLPRTENFHKLVAFLQGDTNNAVMIPVTGHVGPGGEVQPINPASKEYAVDDVECSPGLDPRHVFAIRIKSDSMYPVLHPGWVVYYSDRRDIEIPILQNGWQVPYNKSTEEPLSEFFNKPCVVKLKDGRTMLKTLKRGYTQGRYTLVSYNSPDIEDTEIVWAAKIIFIKTT